MKKAPIAIALVLVFGLFAAAFSLAPAVAQYTPPSDSIGTSSVGNESTSSNLTTTDNATSTNETTTATTNATEGETFSASGSIASLIFDTGKTTTTSELQNDTTTTEDNETSLTGNLTTSDNATTSYEDNTTMTLPQTMTGDNDTGSDNMTSTANETTTAEEVKPPYVASGDWSLEVQDGSVTDFAANLTMIVTDGTQRHTHEFSNFVSSNSTTIDTSGDGTSFIFGTVDVATDGETKWTGADALIIIEKNNVISISLATEDTEDHFGGQPIYGIVDSMTDENGNELIDTGTSTVGNATSGATGGNATDTNQTGGGFADNLTGGIEDFFNSTGP